MLNPFKKKTERASIYWELLRLVLGAIFLWSFLDKVYGLDFATSPGRGWIDGVSPTYGFLKFGTEGGYFAHTFQLIAGNPIVDWLFMLGLFGIGVSLLLGIGTRIAGYSGALMMLLIWFAIFPPEQNPFFDEHIVYMIIFLAFTHENVGYFVGLREKWAETQLVKRFPFLE